MQLTDRITRNVPAMNWKTAYFVFTIVVCMILLGSILISPHRLIYDEPWHMSVLVVMSKIGFLAGLTEPSQSAAGPLYAAIHTTFAPFTELEAPRIRLVNLAVLILILYYLVMVARELEISVAVIVMPILLSVPFLYPTAGIALTELPALLFFTTFVLFFLRLQRHNYPLVMNFVLAALAGTTLGIACIGRQIYIVSLVVAPFLLCKPRDRWPSLLIFLGTMIGSCLWLFLIWGRLTPPGQESVQGQIHLAFLLLSFAYLGLATIFMSPGWFVYTRVSFSVFLTAISVAFLFPIVEIYPARSLIQGLLSPTLFEIYGRLVSGALIALAFFWAYSLIVRAWSYRTQHESLALYALLIAVGSTPLFISHLFSSRYVVAALPCAVLITAPYVRSKSMLIARLLIGAAIGYGTLLSYYAS